MPFSDFGDPAPPDVIELTDQDIVFDPNLDIIEEPAPGVGLAIDARLADHVFSGTTFEQRIEHLVNGANRAIAEAIGTSLVEQESYDEFRDRMLKKMGVVNPEQPGGPLAKFQRQMRAEARLAWNESIIIVNRHVGGGDQVAVWEARLDDRTTPQCWEHHGRLIETELQGETPPLHWGCRCKPRLIPNPWSADPEWAALGQAILAEMAAEREQGDLQESGLTYLRSPISQATARSGHGETRGGAEDGG